MSIIHRIQGSSGTPMPTILFLFSSGRLHDPGPGGLPSFGNVIRAREHKPTTEPTLVDLTNDGLDLLGRHAL